MTIAQKDETVAIHDALWPQRVRMISDKLHLQFPDVLHGRVEAGTAIAQHPKRFRLTDGVWEVADMDAQQWYAVNGHCDCPDTEALEHWCKHRLAINIYQRAREIPDEELVVDPATYGQEPPPAEEESHCPEEDTGPTIPRQFITVIKGKRFVQYVGLLAMAHAKGLVKLEARFVSVTSQLALAEATALFTDGSSFSEAADATPDNVNWGVKDHFARCALTRAKARALRDALNVSMCAVEELDA